MVYAWAMTMIAIDIDDEACTSVMRRYGLQSKREAVNLALHMAVVEPMSLKEARAMRGSGWEGDLDEMRSSRYP